MASPTETQQGNSAGNGPATATAVNQSKPPADGETIPAADAFIGRVLSHYRLEERLGAGGMGVLYRAIDLKLGRSVAIKLLARHLVSDETAKARFVREARAASALDHPNIANVHDIGEEEGELFIVMALYDGETLKQHLERGRLPVDEAVEILRQVVLGLEAAHRAGIVHRDVKPANIVRTSSGAVKILDFGIAKLLGEPQAQMTQAGQAMRTVLYMSPEQLRGEPVDARSDLWSLGVLAYEVLAGVLPFQTDSSAATAMRILNDEPVSLASVPGVPSQLAELVSQLLHKNAAERPQSASEVRARLNQSPQVANSRTKGVTALGQTRNGKYYVSFAVLVVVAFAAVGLYWYGRGVVAPNKIKSLVVLPFINGSGNADAEYLSDGITEGLINSLAQIPELQVIARATAFRYKGKEVDFQKLGRDLSVDAVLTGRVQQLPDSLVVQADLVKISTGSQLWGERYDRKMKDISGMQEELTRSISEKLRPRLTAQEQRRVSKRETASPEAYQLYLRGRHFHNKKTKEAMEKSVDYFQQAIELDPQYALAYAALASVYSSLAYYQYSPQQDAFSKAEVAAQKALALDEELAEAHGSLGFIKFQKWKWAEAETEFKRALALNPSYSQARNNYGLYLGAMRQYEGALAQFKRAQELDPASPLPVANVGWLLCRGGRYERGIAGVKDALELDPNLAHGHYALALVCYAPQNMYSEAIDEARKALALGPSSPIYLGTLAFLCARGGNKAEAVTILEKLLKWDESADPAVSIAEVYLGLGDLDNAIAWLEKAYQRHSNRAIWLNADPPFASLRSDPRFVDLLRRMGFPE